MAEITEVFEDIKDKVGDKGFIALILCAVTFVIYYFYKGSNDTTSNDVATVTTVASYPDTVTNANVIIDTLQDSIDYSEGVILEEIKTQFEATNNYINKGLESAVNIDDKISGLKDNVETIGNISAVTYYETMLHQGRDGYLEYSPEKALAVLENSGFDTSKENGTNSQGNLTNTAGSKGGGWTTFTPSEG